MLVRRLLPLAVALLGASLAGCSKDEVLPDQQNNPVCGNNRLEPGEQCDVASPGCVNCQIVPDWTCTATSCSLICGDGVVGTGSDCEKPQRDTDCDMTGYWAARETDYSRDAVVDHPQAQSGWRLFHFTQSGTNFTVDQELDCGTHISGSAAVDFTPATLRGLIYINRMDGQDEQVDGGVTRPARHGTSAPVAGGCAVTLERWYLARGIVESLLPPDFSTDTPFSSLPPIPSETDPVHGTDWPAGATDPDGDGIPGTAFQITGVVTGVRNAAQRIWKEYATPSGVTVTARALTFQVPGNYDLQENVLRVTDCDGVCPLLASGSTVATDLPPYLLLSFIGKTLGSPRVAPVVVGAPRANLDADLTTCANIRQILPHDPTIP